MEGIDINSIVRQAIQEYSTSEQAKAEPAHKAELVEERRRREQLERRVNELVDENKRTRQVALEADRSAAVRAELQRLGVAKIDLAYKAVQDGIVRTEDGRLIARGDSGEVPVRDFLSTFVSENPEFLPARIPGGSGMTPNLKAPIPTREHVDIEKIRPGMSAEDMQRVKEEIARVASQTFRGM
jgi:hypothetical protein